MTKQDRASLFLLLAFTLVSSLCSACSTSGDIPSIHPDSILPSIQTPSKSLPSAPTENPQDLDDSFDSVVSSLAPSLINRWESGISTPEDKRLVEYIQSGQFFIIDGLHFNTLKATETQINAPPGSTTYVFVHPVTGHESTVAWIDIETGEVIEVSTSYPLNIRSDPGIGTEHLPTGEQLYRYGFAWYPQWGRILPEPMIKLIQDFYSNGVDHVRASLKEYQIVADPDYSGGDLNRVTWNDDLPSQMLTWGFDLPAAPFIALPDSQTVDVRDERFEAALTQGMIRIDEDSVKRYLTSSYPSQSWYDTNQTREEVILKLTSPLRFPSHFSDMEKAFILGAIFDERGPLTIKIDFELDSGYFVPDSGEKELRIAPREVDLMFGYEGIYLSKFPHEMAHIIEARDYPFIDERCWPNEADMKETMKYMLEFMWWVQQYPGDAPSWDWEPINSGLTLARLLNSYFPNSSC